MFVAPLQAGAIRVGVLTLYRAKPGPLVLATRAGAKAVQVPEVGDVTVDMGPPKVGEPPL